MGKFTGSTVSERIMGAPIVLSASVMSHVTDEVLLTVVEYVLIHSSNFWHDNGETSAELETVSL